MANQRKTNLEIRDGNWLELRRKVFTDLDPGSLPNIASQASLQRDEPRMYLTEKAETFTPLRSGGVHMGSHEI